MANTSRAGEAEASATRGRTTTRSTRTTTKAPAGGSGAYANCTAAWNAGAAPLRRGEPGYGPKLDDDDDGVACEKDPR